MPAETTKRAVARATAESRREDLARALRREPLIGVTAAAKLLGIKAPNFRRDAGERLTALPVEGTASVYFRNEVVALARERARHRAKQNGNS